MLLQKYEEGKKDYREGKNIFGEQISRDEEGNARDEEGKIISPQKPISDIERKPYGNQNQKGNEEDEIFLN
ncbi:MAG: hypothetical protein J6T94_03330 [Bacteroidaceae bacterium]|nr:hypothetical protein [Bacteroidaceae bacterium]